MRFSMLINVGVCPHQWRIIFAYIFCHIGKIYIMPPVLFKVGIIWYTLLLHGSADIWIIMCRCLVFFRIKVERKCMEKVEFGAVTNIFKFSTLASTFCFRSKIPVWGPVAPSSGVGVGRLHFQHMLISGNTEMSEMQWCLEFPLG